jgi:cardiolipin synthase (CMP-forming)
VVSAADYLSLVRIPLGVAFVLTAGQTAVALAVLAAAGLSDMLDGWLARRMRGPDDHAPHRGDWLDPLCDKLFMAAVVLGLYLVRQPPLYLLVLLLAREILQTVSVTIMRLVPSLHRASRDYNFKAHPLGKATTVVQFLTGALLLLGHPLAQPAAFVTAGAGALSLAIYINRLRAPLAATTPPPAARRSDR